MILARAWAVAHAVAWSGVQVEISGGRSGLGGQLNLEKAVGTTDCPDNTDEQGLGLDLSHTSQLSGLP